VVVESKLDRLDFILGIVDLFLIGISICPISSQWPPMCWLRESLESIKIMVVLAWC